MPANPGDTRAQMSTNTSNTRQQRPNTRHFIRSAAHRREAPPLSPRSPPRVLLRAGDKALTNGRRQHQHFTNHIFVSPELEFFLLGLMEWADGVSWILDEELFEQAFFWFRCSVLRCLAGCYPCFTPSSMPCGFDILSGLMRCAKSCSSTSLISESRTVVRPR
jgi:hypothetical protein